MNALAISRRFEEGPGARKNGMPVWNAMLRGLKQGRAAGIIIQRMDRVPRNLEDYAKLAGLTAQGIEIHVANESLTHRTQGLSVNILAGAASEFIRSLRDDNNTKGI
jgi:site-specific DNA recombinase